MNAWLAFKRMPIVVPFACIATVLMLFISEWAYFQSVSQLNALVATDAVQTSIQHLRQHLRDAEVDQHSANPQPYGAEVKNIEDAMTRAAHHDAGDPQASALLAQLRRLTSTNTAKIADIHELTAVLLLHATTKVEASKTKLYQTLMTARIGMAVLSAISLLALFLYLRQAFSLKRHQVAKQGLIQMDHDRLEIEVAHRTLQLTELTHHLQTAREDERNRLARNLHDELGALLTSAKLDAARIKSRLAGTAPEALERLAHLVDTLNSSIALGRRIIEDLRPSTLGNLGLVPTLEILAREFSERSGLATHCELAPVQLDATAELMIYRLMQEAITNITKYAKARQVWLSLSTEDGYVQASVRDDGVGFDTTIPPTSAYGLVGMRYRVEAEGGTLRVVSSPGEGTLIQVTLPQAMAV